jgi:DNA-binding response OmpR family regulator
MDLRAALHGAGFHVSACESRASARQALRGRPCAVAIVDAHLIDGSGIDFVKEIRSIQPNVRVLVLAEKADPRMRATAAAAGAEEILSKPIEMVPLLHLAVRLAGNPLRAPQMLDPSRGPTRRRRVLLVDANEVFQRALADAIRSDGEEVIVSGSAAEALEFLSLDRVDAALIDYRLPEGGGVELCRRIRSHPLQRSIPILMVARPTDDVDAFRRAMAAGADDLVVRSKEPAIVKIRLRGLLNRAQRAAEAGEDRGSARSSLEDLAQPAAMPRSIPKARSVPPPPGLFGDRSARVPSVPPGPPGFRDRDLREGPDSTAHAAWSSSREAGDDPISRLLPLGSGTSRDPWEPRPSSTSRRPSSPGNK